ncbi:hypothetical protein DPEC_G00307080 [Dallia pectoralis]|uniref:Uncharacterized protein n=1 Tax=Dallia pectoralis TaxID=75939 RepID=A0ACC2FE97_DALPE|nr:hypothetical protein DPEC_G00307080 [Dallia pectoralis]
MFSDTPDQGLATDVQQLEEIGDIKVDPGPLSSVVHVVNDENNPAVASVVVNPICSASPPSPSGPRDQPVKDCLEMKDLMSSLLQDVCEANTMVLQKEGGPSSTPRKGKRRFRENKDGLYSDRMEPERSKWNQDGLYSDRMETKRSKRNQDGLYSDRMETKRSKWNQQDLYSYRRETERSKGDQEDLYSYSKYNPRCLENQEGLFSYHRYKEKFSENQDVLHSYHRHIKRSMENQVGLLSYHKYKEMFNKNLEVFHANIVQPKRSRKNQEDLHFHLSGSRKRKREDVKTPQTFTYSKRSKD